MQARLAPLALLAGAAAAVGTLAVYQWWWGLALAAATSLVVVLTAPPGFGTRLPYGLAYAGVVGLVSSTRSEGDYLITASVAGYVVLGLAMVVVMLSVATLPRPGRRGREFHRVPGDSAALE